MPNDAFARNYDPVTGPATDCFAINPSDSAALPSVTKAIYVGSGGDIVVRCLRSAGDVTFRAVAGGSILDVRAVAIRATGTTASNIVGMA